MKVKNILNCLWALCIAIALSGCTKETQHTEIISEAIQSIQMNMASYSMMFSIKKGDILKSVGIIWSTQNYPTLENNEGAISQSSDLFHTNSMHHQLRDLKFGQTYYVRGFIVTSSGLLYSRGVQFTTNNKESEKYGEIETLHCDSLTYSRVMSFGTHETVHNKIFIPYSGGNGGTYAGAFIRSTNTMMQFTFSSGQFEEGDGVFEAVVYGLSSLLSTDTAANFSVVIGGQHCEFSIPLDSLKNIGISCGSRRMTGSLNVGVPATDVYVTLTAVSSGGYHKGYVIPTIGGSGLTAVLQPGWLPPGHTELIFKIEGTPTGIGNAFFSLDFAGSRCWFQLPIN
ncbi:MAG: hypothetical protein LAT76_00870 [Schleiferiaceae bacterium]|nr:hypothetical protein [Schleiferiaceae bacterium]